MTQLKSQSKVEDLPGQQNLEQDLLQTTMKVQSQSSGIFSNFMTIVGNKTDQMLRNIIGGFGYTPKNQFTYAQKQKMLSYLQAKVFTINAQGQEMQKIKFTDYDQHFLDTVPTELEAVRNKIIKARTNLDAAEQSLQKMKKERDIMTINYINQQSYEFDKVKYNSMAWGFLFGAFINTTLYRRGSPIRKAALFLAFGHFFGVASYLRNLDRYFDSVYPIFEKDAVKFSKKEKQEFKGWKPQGSAQIDE